MAQCKKQQASKLYVMSSTPRSSYMFINNLIYYKSKTQEQIFVYFYYINRGPSYACVTSISL